MKSKVTKVTPDRRGRRHGCKEKMKPVFLRAFRASGKIGESAKIAGVSRDTVWDWRNADPKFEEQYRLALAGMLPLLETEALQRAMAGSDPLLVRLLEAADPKRFGKRLTHELATEQLDELISMFSQILQSKLPDTCPGCNTNLGLKPAMAKEMLQLSAQMKTRQGVHE